MILSKSFRRRRRFIKKELMKMKTVKVVAAIIHRDGKIFATARGYGDFKGGWEFPGGNRAGRDPGGGAEARDSGRARHGDPGRGDDRHDRV